MKTKLHLLSCIGSLSQAVVKLQQAWNELTFFRKNAGLASTEEESALSLAKDKKKSSKRAVQSVSSSPKRERKKVMPEPTSIPVKIPVRLEEWIHDQAPLLSPQTLHTENTV
jgi:hypothetical protein